MQTHLDSSNQRTHSISALEASFYSQPCLNVVLGCPSMQKASSG